MLWSFSSKAKLLLGQKKSFQQKSSCFKWLLSFQFNRFWSKNRAASTRSLYHNDLCSEIRWRKVQYENWIAANFNVRKMYSTAERINDCEHSAKIILEPLKERIDRTKLFGNKELLMKELLKQWKNASSPVKTNPVPYKQ